MRYIQPGKAALAVGMVLGLYHLMWITLVATGLAKPFMDFVLRLHFISLDFSIATFAASTAALLVGLTFVLGAVFGFIFALIWNWLTGARDKAVPSTDPLFSR